MSKGMEDSNKISRRTLLAGTAAIAAKAAMPNRAEAGVLYDVFGIGPNPEKVRELKDPFYTARKYLDHEDGKLRKNFERLQAVGVEMKAGKYKNLDNAVRNQKLAPIENGIRDEKNLLMKHFDPELITDLLVEYIQNGLTDQALVTIFTRVGGKVEHIRDGGRAGIKSGDMAAIANISSVMIYHLEKNPTPDYGKVYHSRLTFVSHEAPKDR